MDEKLKALDQCSVVVFNSLDTKVICPVLIKSKLLTNKEHERLQIPHISYSEKIQYLLDVLPRKGKNWFDKFIECLKETSDGTGHGKIVKELEHAIKNIDSRTTSMEHDDSPTANEQGYHHAGMSLPKLKAKPTLKKFINIVVPRVAPFWRELAIQLDIEPTWLHMIAADNANDSQRCCIEMFSYWLDHYPDASWQNLIHALKAVDLNSVAADIEKLLEPGHPTSTSLNQSGILELEPRMGDINRIVVPRIQAEWEDVAYALRYRISAVRAIKEKHNDNPKKCCKELFIDWLSTDHGVGPKTWSTLLEKLQEVEELAAIASEIITELQKRLI